MVRVACQAAAVLLMRPPRSQRAAFDGCLERVRHVPGVTAVSSTSFYQVTTPVLWPMQRYTPLILNP